MKRRAAVQIIVLLIILVGPLTLYAQNYTTFEEVVQEYQVSFQWDAYRRQGVFVRGTSSLSFDMESGVAVENYQQIHHLSSVESQNGEMRFGEDFLAVLGQVFPPEIARRRVSAIFIDPGHGGRDPGAIGRHQIDGETQILEEKDVVLSVGSALAEMLRRRYPDKEIVMSRSEDVYLTLEERTQRANALGTASNEAVVFVSIHANASLNRDARGFEVWYLPTEVRRDNLVSAEQLGVDDPDLLSILNTLREEEITIESVLLARNVLAGMDARIGTFSPNRGLREESWYVVRNAKMPSILIELGFVTNTEEFQRLQNSSYLLELTRGVYTGIENFVRSFEGFTIER